MGNREALIAGAKKGLFEKGYTRTTARDIASAAGVSLAAIGYHFGSKEALLNAALYEAIEEWGEGIQRGFAAEIDAGAPLLDRFAAIADRVMLSFSEHRQFWAMQFEMIAQAEHTPAIREVVMAGLVEGKRGFVELFHGEVDAATEKLVGPFYHAMVTGLLTQFLIDPASLPSGRDLAQTVRLIAGG